MSKMKEEKQKSAGKENNLLFYLAVILLILSLIIFGYNLIRVTKITGKVTATLNLTVEPRTNINFTNASINWNSGQVNPGKTFAQLNTAAVGAGNITNGNWSVNYTGSVGGLILENIGNQNVTLDLAAGKSALQFLGGTNPGYQWNVSNYEVGSCTNTNASASIAYAWNNFSNTNLSMRICRNFSFAQGSNSIRIDFNITIPSDSITGAVSDIITATATAEP